MSLRGQIDADFGRRHGGSIRPMTEVEWRVMDARQDRATVPGVEYNQFGTPIRYQLTGEEYEVVCQRREQYAAEHGHLTAQEADKIADDYAREIGKL